MAKVRQPQPAPVAPAGFVASAVRLPNSSRNMAGRPENWQGEAWRFWENVGELRYVATWIGNVLSRATLVAAKREGRLLVPISGGDSPATEAMDALYGGPQGQSQMLQLFGVHTTIAGDEYIVNRAKGDAWETLAYNKVTQLPGGVLQADFGTEAGPITLTPQDLVIRVWMPNPQDPTRPDSPVRPNLSTLAQITGYDMHVSAQIASRLAGAGILFMSSDIDFPVPEGMDPNASPASRFMAILGESMMTPIGDRADPSALVPIVAMVPTEALGKQEHLKFWSELDDKVVVMRDAAIKRLALGMDVPPEVLLGVADANHWNAWLSEESAVKAHLEPKLATLAYALTEQYLQPSLKGLVPDDEVGDYFVIADTSGIRLRPNRSQEAIELYDRNELSGVALRRETGFQPEDAPLTAEQKMWLLRKIAVGSTTPEMTEAALKLLGTDLGTISVQPAQLPPDHLRTDVTPALERRNPPDQNEPSHHAKSEQVGLAAACDVLVYRALERAGNKLMNAHPKYDAKSMATVDVYRTLNGDTSSLLAGAWACAPAVLASYTGSVESVIETLDFYVRGLLESQRPHSATVLSALLAATMPRALEAVP